MVQWAWAAAVAAATGSGVFNVEDHGAKGDAVTVPAAAAPEAASAPEAPWTSLFDGQTLAGWVKYGGPATFEAQGGAIVGTFVMDDGGRESTYLATDKEFGDFELEMEFKAAPGINAGVQFRSFHDQATRGKVQGYQ